MIEGNEPVIVLNSRRFLHILVAEWDCSAKHAVKTYTKPDISQQIPLLMLNPDKLSGCCCVEENDHEPSKFCSSLLLSYACLFVFFHTVGKQAMSY